MQHCNCLWQKSPHSSIRCFRCCSAWLIELCSFSIPSMCHPTSSSTSSYYEESGVKFIFCNLTITCNFLPHKSMVGVFRDGIWNSSTVGVTLISYGCIIHLFVPLRLRSNQSTHFTHHHVNWCFSTIRNSFVIIISGTFSFPVWRQFWSCNYEWKTISFTFDNVRMSFILPSGTSCTTNQQNGVISFRICSITGELTRIISIWQVS